MFALQKGGLENRKPEMTICLQEKDPVNYNFRGHSPLFPWLCLTTSIRGNVLVPPNSDIIPTEVFFSLCPFPWSCKISVGSIYLSVALGVFFFLQLCIILVLPAPSL